MAQQSLPINHPNSVLEKVSELNFRTRLPSQWLVDKPIDVGIDLIVSLVQNNQVTGLNFAVQLKAKQNCRGKLSVKLKKSTLNYLFNRLEPAMVVLYDQAANEFYWKWLIYSDFDLSKPQTSYTISFDKNQSGNKFDRGSIETYVQRIFKIQKWLLTSQEYDLFNSSSEVEAKAWSHYFTGNRSEAIFHFRRLLKIENKAIWYLALAQCEYDIHEYARALHSINLALELDTSDNVLMTKASILAEDGIVRKDRYKLLEAEKIFSQLHLKAPTAINCYNYANTLNHLNQATKAEELYKYALKLKPNFAECWKNLGQLYTDNGEFKSALKCYNQALKINPVLPQAVVSKAINIGFASKKYLEGLELLWKGIKLDADIFLKYPRVFYWLSFFYMKLGDWNEALIWVNRGLEHQPGDSFLINQKIEIFRKALQSNENYVEEGILFFTELHNLNPHDAVVYLYLCEVIMLRDGLNAASLKVYDWYINVLPYSKEITSKILRQYKLEDLMHGLRYWNDFNGYLKLYSIDAINAQLKEKNLYDTTHFLIEFQINRILFMDNLQELFTNCPTTETLTKQIEHIAINSIELFTASSLSAMVEPQDLKSLGFAKSFAETITTSSFLYFTEFPRTVGYLMGLRHSEKRIPLENVLDSNTLLFETITRFSKHLYIKFNLPLE